MEEGAWSLKDGLSGGFLGADIEWCEKIGVNAFGANRLRYVLMVDENG